MGYDKRDLVGRLKALLADAAGRSLASIAEELNVDRHTVTRSVRRVEGVSFKQLQFDFIAAALDRIALGPRPTTGKEIAARLGLASQRRVRAWRRRTSPSRGDPGLTAQAVRRDEDVQSRERESRTGKG